jgi:hypothetical protein
LRHHLRDRFNTAAQTARQTIGIHQRPVSDDTIRRRLAANNLACRHPAKSPILTPRHRQERLQWATDRRNWRHQQWRNIIFSDYGSPSSFLLRHTRECIGPIPGSSRAPFSCLLQHARGC